MVRFTAPYNICSVLWSFFGFYCTTVLNYKIEPIRGPMVPPITPTETIIGNKIQD